MDTDLKQEDIACHCHCHTQRGVMHAVNCCVTCPICKVRIKRSKSLNHEKTCELKEVTK